MPQHSWVQEFPGAITVCDHGGIILEMNDKAVRTFQEQGGAALIGTNLLDCHPEPARTNTRELLDSRRANVYTIEKRGQKKLIYQAPWYENGQYRGFVEVSQELPAKMPTSSASREGPAGEPAPARPRTRAGHLGLCGRAGMPCD